jgi:homoserine kinase
MTRLRDGRVRVSAPATSANLGPGFDAVGLALGLRDEVVAQVCREDGVRVTVVGEGAGDLPSDGTHLVARCLLATLDRLGATADGISLTCRNAIPQARGLGSSSAAIVAGILAGRALVADGAERLPDADVLRLASEIEGHPDNVAPCLLGGLTVAWLDGDGARAARLSPDPSLRPVLLVPEGRGLTEVARAALPSSVPHRDAAFNAGRAALLVPALTGHPELLLAATEDRLHQPYRAAGMPETAALVDELRAAGIPAVVSGAGPSVLAFPTTVGEKTAEIPVTVGWRVLTPGVDARGATVEVDWQHAERDPVAAGRAS